MIGIVSRNAIVMPALALALLFSAVPAAFAASFDCGRAGGAIEKQICADPQLSALDGRLAVAYSTALKATDDYGKKALAKEQRNWIRYTRDICEDASCLQQAYTDRITVLSRNEKDIIDSGDGTVPDGRTIMRLRDPSIRIDAFNTSIAGDKRSGRIIGCSELIGLAPRGRGQQHHLCRDLHAQGRCQADPGRDLRRRDGRDVPDAGSPHRPGPGRVRAGVRRLKA